ncbi:amidase [Ideonella sp. A 288]|uniref:amidase n=1 Tax=Ideonella sp. A 288 TaxID=1962181 RepID=UPI000B4B14E0|nr:amidase [Ideonella sp. A 288]
MSRLPTALWQLSAVALAESYRRRDATPSQVLASCFERIDAVNPRLNALVALRREAAFAEAARSDERFARGAPLGPLDGLPLAVKDNIPSVDLPTTWGSVAGRDHRPAQDELALARARAGGALVVGKTNVPEFTLEGYTGNALFGTTRNPWNPALTPGGSSGGSVAAVAAGMVPLALGTDGGGSTRRPASHTGLVGFKPSIGAIAREHALPPLLLDFEVIGPIARSIADVQLLFNALRGPHAADWRSQVAPGPAAMPSPLRVLYVPTLDAAPVDAEIAASCRAAAARLATMGHAVEEGALPLDLGFMTSGWPVVGQIGLAWLFERHPAWRDGASAKYLAMADTGAQVPAATLWQLLETVEQLRRNVARLFERIDLIVTPAAAALPWPADEPYPPVIDGQPVGPRGHAIFTAWVNAAGLPAVALPCEPSATGLPIGVQLIGPRGHDQALLGLAGQFEAAAPRGWAWPPL